ncbi:MAG TPA: hypothetical protein VFF84_02405 [Sphingobium sp.]|nr:hypothetical protein [Sphingobium sp.]
MGFFDTVARLEREQDANLARVESIRNEIVVTKSKRDASADFDEAATLDDQIVTLERRLKLAEGVADGSAGRLQIARSKAQEKAADAEHAAAEKQAADTKPERAALIAIEKAIAAIMIVAERNRATEAANSIRGQRAVIVDGETRLRQTPGRTIPAEWRDEIVWSDSAGNRPSVFREVNGEMVPVEQGFTRRTERVCVQPERVIPPTMPDRLAELLPALRKALE